MEFLGDNYTYLTQLTGLTGISGYGYPEANYQYISGGNYKTGTVMWFPQPSKDSKNWDLPEITGTNGSNSHFFFEWLERVPSWYDEFSPRVNVKSLIADEVTPNGVLFPRRILERIVDVINNKGGLPVTITRNYITEEVGHDDQRARLRRVGSEAIPQPNMHGKTWAHIDYDNIAGTAVQAKIHHGQLDFYIAIHHHNGTVGPIGMYLYDCLRQRNHQDYTLRFEGNIYTTTSSKDPAVKAIVTQYEPSSLSLITYDNIDIYSQYNYQAHPQFVIRGWLHDSIDSNIII